MLKQRLALTVLLIGFTLNAYAAKPNIIYILADDLGYGDIAVNGQSKTKTPNIDKLAAEGMSFTAHYSGSTVCAPSRASLLTGLNTGHSQIRGNYEFGGFADAEEHGQMPLHMGTPTIASVLKQANYKTAIIGKWGLGGPHTEGEPKNHGFDEFYGYLDQKQSHNFYPTHLWKNSSAIALNNPYIYPHQRFEGDINNPQDYKKYQGKDYAPARISSAAIDFIDKNKHQPFFLYLAYTAPHAALQVPDEDRDEYVFAETPYLGGEDYGYLPQQKPRAARAAMITHMDKGIGAVRAKLAALGLLENTVVIFSSDNGPSHEGGADLEFFKASGPFRGGKRDLYEGGIRMPMIASWPGKIAKASQTNHVSAFWDVLPTLADLAGVKSPEGIDGLSFASTLLGQTDGQAQHASLYWEFHGQWQGHKGSQALRFGRWKAIRKGLDDSSPSNIEIYDLSIDPSEINNIAAAQPGIVQRARVLFSCARNSAVIKQWNFPKDKCVYKN